MILFGINEVEFSEFNFTASSQEFLFTSFKQNESNCRYLLGKKLTLPAYECCVKASHLFNLLDARGLISVSERQAYILKVRDLSRLCCKSWIERNNA